MSYRFHVVAIAALACLIGWNVRDTRPQPPMKWDPPSARVLAGDMIDARGEPMPAQVLIGAQRIVLYFSASWCPACQDFTPTLVDFYRKNGGGKAFQLLLISGEDSNGEMRAYMHDDRMPWWGVRVGSPAERLISRSYHSDTIPYLVLLDSDGRVLADSHHGGTEAVLAAITKK